MANQFESIVSARAVGTQDIDNQAAAIRKLSDSIDGLATKAAKVNEQSKFDNFAQKVKAGLSDPLGAAGEMAESFLTKIGPVGAGVAGLATAFAAVGVAGMSFMRDLGRLGDEIGDTAVRMGLTTKETQEFRFAMKYAGGDMSSLEGIMRKLSAEIDDGGENLKAMGVQFRDAATGGVRPMSGIILELSQRLGGMTDTAHRNAEAVKVLGKSAMQILPDLLELPEAMKAAQKAGLIYSDQTLDSFNQMHKQMVIVDQQWEFLTNKLKQGVTIPVMWFFGSGVNKNPEGKFGSANFPLEFGNEDGTAGMSPEFRAKYLAGKAQQALAANQTAWDNKPLIASNDATVAAARRGTVEDQLASAKKKLSDDLKALKDGVLPEVNKATLEAVAADRANIASIEGKIAANKVLGASIDEVIKKVKDQTKAWEDATAKMLGGKVELFTRANPAPVPQQSILEFMLQRQIGQMSTFRNRGNSAEDLAAEFSAAQAQRIREGEQNLSLQSGRDSFDISTQQARGASPNAIYNLRIRQIDREYEAQKELAREKNSQLDLDRALADHTENRYRAAIERENELRQIGLRQKQEFQQLAVGGLDALLTGNGKGFLKSAGMGLLNQVAGNFAGEAWKEISKVIPHSDSKYLKGTLFEANPLKSATDLNTAATIENTNMLRDVAISRSSGGGSAGGYAGSVSNFVRAYGGYRGGAADSYNSPLMATAGYGVEEFDSAGNGVYAANPNSGGSRGGMNFASKVGIAGAAVGGGLGIYAGARQGGIRGGLNAGGAASGATSAILMAAGVTGPLAPILMGVGLALPFIASLFPDPKKQRGEALQREADSRAYAMPTGADYAVDTYGRGISYDARGGLRPIQITQVFQAGAISAIDGPNLQQHLVNNPSALAVGLTNMVQSGNGDDALAVFSRS